MKLVTNEEFNQAIADPNNIKIMEKASNKYSKILRQEKNTIVLTALWESLQEYDNIKARGMKFTSFLFKRVRWACYDEAKKIIDNRLKYVPQPNMDMYQRCYINSTFIFDILQSLDDSDYKLAHSKYIENKTLKEIGSDYNVSPQCIRKRLVLVNRKIKRILTC